MCQERGVDWRQNRVLLVGPWDTRWESKAATAQKDGSPEGSPLTMAPMRNRSVLDCLRCTWYQSLFCAGHRVLVQGTHCSEGK